MKMRIFKWVALITMFVVVINLISTEPYSLIHLSLAWLIPVMLIHVWTMYQEGEARAAAKEEAKRNA